MKRIREMGERKLLEHILSTLREKSIEGFLPVGDDAAAVSFDGKLVVASDMLVEYTDKPPRMTWRQAGRKAVVSTISDIAAKGAEPRYILVSLGLRPDMLFIDFQELWRGIVDASDEYSTTILGGDINECSTVVVDVMCIGSGDKLIPRSGAREGELVGTTGLFGRTGAGLHALLNNIEADREILEAVLNPSARVREGKALAETGAVSSCIDSSDGLAYSLWQLAEMSNVGIVIEKLPASREAVEYAEQHGLEAERLILYGGEEYELIFTFNREKEDEVRRTLSKTGCELHVIGEVINEHGVFMKSKDGKMTRLSPVGYEHFKTP